MPGHKERSGAPKPIPPVFNLEIYVGRQLQGVDIPSVSRLRPSPTRLVLSLGTDLEPNLAAADRQQIDRLVETRGPQGM